MPLTFLLKQPEKQWEYEHDNECIKASTALLTAAQVKQGLGNPHPRNKTGTGRLRLVFHIMQQQCSTLPPSPPIGLFTPCFMHTCT